VKWYKHDANANADAKLKKLRIKYGMEGYGLYWYCLELICDGIDESNINFDLEHDSEIISHDTGIHYERVQEMMSYMVKLELFEMNQGVVTCMKMAKRLDKSMTSNPKMRQLIDKIRNNHAEVMIPSCVSHDSVMQDKTRLDKNKHTTPSAPSCPYQDIVDVYHEILPNLPEVKILSDKRKKYLKSRWLGSKAAQEVGWWRDYFEKVSQSDFLMGRTENKFQANFEWLITESNFIKVLEGNYERG